MTYYDVYFFPKNRGPKMVLGSDFVLMGHILTFLLCVSQSYVYSSQHVGMFISYKYNACDMCTLYFFLLPVHLN